MQCSDHKEGGEVVLTLVIVRNGLNVYDGAQENTEDGGDLNLITTTIIAVTVYWELTGGKHCIKLLTYII